MLELELSRPDYLALSNLRSWVLDKLNEHGKPLRWAITEANSSRLKVEAIVIISQS